MISFCIEWKLGKIFSDFPFDAKTYHVVISKTKNGVFLVVLK